MAKMRPKMERDMWMMRLILGIVSLILALRLYLKPEVGRPIPRPGGCSIHPSRRFWSQGGPKMGPSWLQVEPRAQRTTLQKQAFRMGVVSKIKVSGSYLGSNETNSTA